MAVDLQSIYGCVILNHTEEKVSLTFFIIKISDVSRLIRLFIDQRLTRLRTFCRSHAIFRACLSVHALVCIDLVCIDLVCIDLVCIDLVCIDLVCIDLFSVH